MKYENKIKEYAATYTPENFSDSTGFRPELPNNEIISIESRLGNVTITLPTISNMTSSIPSIVEIDATFKQGYFADVEFKQLLITNGCGVINRVSYDFASRFPRKNKNIDNTEEYPTMEKKIEVNNPVRVRKTQIEKFNERLAKKKGSN